MTRGVETPEQYATRIRNRDVEDMRSILKSAYGQRFMWRLLSRCGVLHQSFVAGSPDATAFNEGRRSIGNALLAEVLEIRPEAYVEMTKKAKEDEDVRQTIQQAAQEAAD